MFARLYSLAVDRRRVILDDSAQGPAKPELLMLERIHIT